MPVRLFNTMSQRLETLQPLQPGLVRIYTCGPTVHDRPHIGNFRAFLAEDLLRRHLEARGLRVEQVMNITDVDDKIIAKADTAHLSLAEFTRPFVDAFFADLERLAIEPAEHYPRATDYVDQMLELVQRLVDSGHAYPSEGSVYFRIASFPAYGRLSRLELEGLRAGGSGRIDADEYDPKEVAGDFALWKAAAPGDAASWPSPFGRGRPGWHLECSAMAMTLLGDSFDIHCGGVDNTFPHHENEIAQSESVTGKPLARVWFHVEHLLLEGGKMAKSQGNVMSLDWLGQRGYSPLTVRYHILSNTHYRQKLHFREQDLVGAAESLDRLATFWRRCSPGASGGLPELGSGDPLAAAAQHALDLFERAMDDDLNLPKAVGELHNLVREGNRLLDQSRAGRQGCAVALGALRTVDTRLAVIERTAGSEDATLSEPESQLLERRQEAKAKGNYAKADRIRDQLLEQGILLEDTKEGSRWRRL
ncbi:MAG: cysteine--tRNA ligase [Candidatus Dormibacteria bacterium]